MGLLRARGRACSISNANRMAKKLMGANDTGGKTQERVFALNLCNTPRARETDRNPSQRPRARIAPPRWAPPPRGKARSDSGVDLTPPA